MTHRQWSALALCALMGVYLALGSIYAVGVPVFEKPDEEWHYAYAVYLLQNRRLPPLTADVVLNPARQEAGQPPLFYGLGAIALRWLGQPDGQPTLRPNPYWAYPAPGTVNDNKNRFVHQAAEVRAPPYRSVFVLRGLSLAMGVGAVVSAYGLARALGYRPSVGLASAATVAVLPQYLFIAGSVSNDALVATLSGGAVWALVAALRRRSVVRTWLFFGALAGLATLAKTSALLVPLIGAGAAIAAGYRHRSARTAIAGTAASLGGVVVFAGWWYVRNLSQSGDPLGLGIHFVEMGRAQPLSAGGLLTQWQAVETSLWAAFGWGNVLLPGWAYWGLRAAEILAVVGLTRLLFPVFRKQTRRTDEWHLGHWVVLLHLAAVGASLAWWTRTVSGSLGRLLFPALVPLAVMMVAGWARLWSRLLIICVGWLATLALISPALIARAYQPPTMLQVNVAPSGAQRVQINFGDLAQLYAFEVSSHRLSPGDTVNVTACWRALERTSTDYSVFIHILGEANAIIGRRETYPGLGSYATSLWRAGASFCDEYAVPIEAGAAGPAVYAVEVGLFDLRTGERLRATDETGQPLELVVLDHVKVAGPSATLPPGVTRIGSNFADQIVLLGYSPGRARPGETLPVGLYWQASTDIADDYTVFIHLLDSSGNIAAQADSPPQAGRYPTHWWDVGETVFDEHGVPIPANLPAGDYRLVAGLYLPATGERLPVVGSGDDSVSLGAIQIGQ